MVTRAKHVTKSLAKFDLNVYFGTHIAESKDRPQRQNKHVPHFNQESISSEDMAPFDIEEGKYMSYTPQFCYLSSLIHYSLRDSVDIQC